MSLARTHPYFWWRRGRVELPVQKKLSRASYKFSQLFNLTWPTSTDRVRPGQPVFLSPPVPAFGQRHPGFSAPNPSPSGWGSGWMATYLVRLQPLLVLHLFFATGFMRERHLNLQSCNALPLSKPRVPILRTVSIDLLYIF
jgi:hypothetical protein